ncbi:M4 family metallopeptidase [Geothrix sp.]|uniref:M4 family metallopeptidase n=1 Tax=Geothrix sp. TaxID=1962974 RepID=UPI0025B8A646|nr:M4 family metallopeptidase [Geothrix sp.]WIL22394.1 MAG: M4 family metallopeptidase [Geothrix sp.]
MRFHHERRAMRLPSLGLPLLLPVLAFQVASLSAQEPPSLPSTGRMAAIQMRRSDTLATALVQLRDQRPQMGLDEDHDFRLSGSHVDALGQTHGRFDQYYRDVRVWGAQVLTHTGPDGQRLKPSSHLSQGLHLSTTPTLPVAEALARVQERLRPKGTFARPPRVELVVYPEHEAVTSRIITQPGEPLNAYDLQERWLRTRLAYHVRIRLDNAQDGLVQRDYLVDAHDGALLREWDSLVATAPSGAGHSQYSGAVSLDVTALTGSFELRDPSRGTLPHPFTGEVGNAVYSGNKGKGLPGTWEVWIYQDSDNDWGDGANFVWAGSPLSPNGQTAAVDAAHGSQVTWDMYRHVLGREGIDGLGTSIYALVHYNGSGVPGPSPNLANAFWDDGCFCMTYMDGFNDGKTSFSTAFTALDITGHEISHGLCSATAGLIYQGESGGLNESNSDIFGTMTKFYARGGGYAAKSSSIPSTGGNWTVGEQVDTRGFPLRWMYRPSLDGRSQDAWSPTLAGLNVHYSSGPMNRAFALLCNGSGSGDWSSTPAVAALGNDKTTRIWYQALTSYLYPASDYANARRSVLRAALDLYPSEPATLQAIRDAFAAINVGDAAGTGDELTGPAVTLTGGGNAGDLTFAATASDGGAITAVAFRIDGARFASLQSPPYTATLDSTQYANGPHSIVAEAFDDSGNMTRSNRVDVTLDNASQQLLLNPGFEAGAAIWVENNNLIGLFGGADGIPAAHGGVGLARFLGWGASSAGQRISQRVTLPAEGDRIQVSGQLLIVNDRPIAQEAATLSVKLWDLSGTTLATLRTITNLEADAYAGWTPFTCDLSAYRGQTLLVGFEAQRPTEWGCQFYVDDTALTVTGVVAAPGPTLLEEPRSLVVNTGTDATFRVKAASSVGALRYQWQSRTDATSWTDLPAGTGETCRVPSSLAASRRAQVRVQVSDPSGTTTSLPAELKVGPASRDLWPDGVQGDVLDLAMLIRALGRTSDDPDWITKYQAADLNFDNQVDLEDLALFLRDF